jgi:hypothetical protein
MVLQLFVIKWGETEGQCTGMLPWTGKFMSAREGWSQEQSVEK